MTIAPTIQLARLPRPVRWSVESAIEHPIVTAVAVALVVRLALAFASFLANPTHLIGDEVQYVQLADAVASGRGAESWVAGYGQSLYNSTWTFMAPLTLLCKLFGTSRIWAQLLSVGFGAATVAITTKLALEVVRPRLAVLAGLVVALLPSQVVFSSVALRESAVWATVSLVALGTAFLGRRDARWAGLGLAMVAVGMLGLGHLRQQTLVAVAWAVVLAAPFIAARHRVVRTGAVAALALVVPSMVGIGLGGWTLVQRSVPSLGATRTYMSLDAESAFTPTTLLTPSTTAPAGPTTTTTTVATTSTTTTTTPEAGGALGIGSRHTDKVLDAGFGATYAVDDSLDGNVRSFLPGMVAVLFRPAPWEWGASLDVRLASLENAVWYVLYALAVAGLVLGWRRRLPVVLPAFLIGGNIIGIAALTQGNLGTAFRHRGQLVWALAVLAVVGIEELGRRRRDDGAEESDDGSVLVHA